MLASPKALWDNSLLFIKDNVSEQQYNTWFRPIVFESYKPSTKTLLVQVPSPFVYEYLEQNYVGLLSKVLHRNFGDGIRLTYRVVAASRRLPSLPLPSSRKTLIPSLTQSSPLIHT